MYADVRSMLVTSRPMHPKALSAFGSNDTYNLVHEMLVRKKETP